MSQAALTARMQDQYTRYPYPAIKPFAWVARASTYLLNFETMAYLCRRQFVSHRGKRIALIGCGTFEPYVFSVAHPDAEIHAVDLSAESLRIAQKKVGRRKNVFFHQCDIYNLESLNLQFDYINCYGVLHHLTNLNQALEQLALTSTDDAFLRIMAYPAFSRRHITSLHGLLEAQGVAFEQYGAIKKVKKVVANLAADNPLKAIAALFTQHHNACETIDAFLHTYQSPFSIKQLVSALDRSGYLISKFLMPYQASPRYLDALLHDDPYYDPEKLNDTEKMQILDCMGELQANIVAVAQKRDCSKQVTGIKPIIYCNPAFTDRNLWSKRSLYDRLNGRKIVLSRCVEQMIETCKNGCDSDSFDRKFQGCGTLRQTLLDALVLYDVRE